MMTLRQIESGEIAKSIPLPVTWYLSDIGEAKGKQGALLRNASRKFAGLA